MLDQNQIFFTRFKSHSGRTVYYSLTPRLFYNYAFTHFLSPRDFDLDDSLYSLPAGSKQVLPGLYVYHTTRKERSE